MYIYVYNLHLQIKDPQVKDHILLYTWQNLFILLLTLAIVAPFNSMIQIEHILKENWCGESTVNLSVKDNQKL